MIGNIPKYLKACIHRSLQSPPDFKKHLCSCVHKCSLRRVVSNADERSVADSSDDLVDDGQRDQKPFPRSDGLAESVEDLDVKAHPIQHPVDQGLEARTVDVIQLVGGDDIHVSKEVGGIVGGAGNAGFDRAAGDADLVDQVAFAAIFGWLERLRRT